MQKRGVRGFVDVDGQSLDALAPRERILKTASDLFYRLSINSVGIDRIIAESGVAKMTFYKHFPSKADLIATYLRYKSDAWFQMLATATERAGLSPLERVLAIFDALEEPLRAPSFRGCPFVKGLAEFGPEANSPNVQATIAMYFKRLHDFVASLIAPLALSMPEKAVVQILSLVHGSIVIAQSTRDPALVEANRDAARLLLEDRLISSSEPGVCKTAGQTVSAPA
ncbi:transcriptional regulator [Sphingopyxis fribergensis]|uniref:Transcriptional regulator n=1 Tax=Sphingopyxis fribergensis TaxID=1515612 RepID=A0A0A7PT32_9SPHN|nr:TetR/AcrR family transcriptional regulator [Sphingopyxis fribergensis]AJA11182.1 transcriptional regulator [Sphingopyxis fribergensis]